MNFSKTEFEDLYLIDPEVIGDERGWFMRTYSEDIFMQNIPNFNSRWVQMNHSFSKLKGTFRGMHFQNTPFMETKLVRCISGAIIDYVIDIRNQSKTFLKTYNVELNSENKKMLLIPKGFAHGFFTLKDNTELVYLHDQFYNPTYEGGLCYADPEIKLKFPFDPVIVSDRDLNHPFIETNKKNELK
jgi:dTDP-4-dehydrorhamnose 3,5-epimerase